MAQFIEKKRTAFLGLPIYFTTYTIGEELLQIKSGFLKITENAQTTHHKIAMR